MHRVKKMCQYFAIGSPPGAEHWMGKMVIGQRRAHDLQSDRKIKVWTCCCLSIPTNDCQLKQISKTITCPCTHYFEWWAIGHLFHDSLLNNGLIVLKTGYKSMHLVIVFWFAVRLWDTFLLKCCWTYEFYGNNPLLCIELPLPYYWNQANLERGVGSCNQVMWNTGWASQRELYNIYWDVVQPQ